MKPCRECGHEVSEQALICPHCGAPQPAKEKAETFRSLADALGPSLAAHTTGQMAVFLKSVSASE